MSHLTIPQKASLSSAGVCDARTVWKSLLAPYLSLRSSGGGACGFSRLDRRRPNGDLFPPDPLVSAVAAAAGVSAPDGGAVEGAEASGEGVVSAPPTTPKHFSTARQYSFNLTSSSAVRVSGLPGGISTGAEAAGSISSDAVFDAVAVVACGVEAGNGQMRNDVETLPVWFSSSSSPSPSSSRQIVPSVTTTGIARAQRRGAFLSKTTFLVRGGRVLRRFTVRARLEHKEAI